MRNGVLIGLVMLGSAAGWATAQTGRPAQTPTLVPVDQVNVLAARVQQLQNRVQTLEAANEVQGSTILQLAAFRTTANNAIAGLNQEHTTLRQRFETHTHGFQYAHPQWTNSYFVTESHLNGDDKDLASYITGVSSREGTTSQPK